MKEYKITVRAWYDGGWIPDFFGSTHIEYRKANSAKELDNEVRKEIESLGSNIRYKVSIELV